MVCKQVLYKMKLLPLGMANGHYLRYFPGYYNISCKRIDETRKGGMNNGHYKHKMLPGY